MKRFFLFALLVSFAHAADYYVTQAGAGAANGTTLGNAWSAAAFNTSGNWSATPATSGKISPGDTVNLNGTITTALTVQQSGTSGNLITILWASGASVSPAAATCITATSKSYLVFDGGTNGIIENTANGTALANQLQTNGISCNNLANSEIKNLTFQNLYVHAAGGPSGPDLTACAAIHMNGVGDNILIHDNTFHDMCWVITALGSGSSVFKVYHNSFYNFDHGVAGLGGITGLEIYDNHFGTTANWDTPTNTYHHDGVHAFFSANISLAGAKVYRNLFDGDWGVNNTAHLFWEGDIGGGSGTITNTEMFNNVHVAYTGRLLNNGFVNGGGAGAKITNNTFIGANTPSSLSIIYSGTNLTLKNNIFTACNTFFYNPGTVTFASGGLNNNIYYAQAPGGNSKWYKNAVAYNTLPNWQTATGQESASLLSNPTLNGTYGLVAGSPAIGIGADLSASYTTDKNGVTRTVPWDLGAYAFVGSAAPVILLNPLNQSVDVGVTVTFTAAASGSPTPTWQWNKNASPIGGATSATLNLIGVTSADNGSYTATATNTGGSATTTAALLVVATAPANEIPGTPIITGISP